MNIKRGVFLSFPGERNDCFFYTIIFCKELEKNREMIAFENMYIEVRFSSFPGFSVVRSCVIMLQRLFDRGL